MSDRNFIYTTGVSTLDELNDVAITSATSLDILQHNGTQFVNRPVRGTETSTTANSGAANDTVIGANTRRYAFLTMPTGAAYYELTGFEWLNGTVVNGNCQAVVEQVTATPGSDANNDMTLLVAVCGRVGQSGAGVVQRNSFIRGHLVPAGSLLGCSIITASATGRYQTATVASTDNTKAVTFGTDIATQDANAFGASTESPYIKLYYRPVLGV